MTNKKMLEFELINKIKSWLNTDRLIVPIGDDAAAFNLKPDKTTLFAADSLIENVHFKIDKIKPEDLGYKSLVVNISDVAAMGGAPLYATICLGIPPKITSNYLQKFYKGINEAAGIYGLKVVGGDISCAKNFYISISIIGQVDKSKILRRSAAKAGEEILVTGKLGSSSAGLKISQISQAPRQMEVRQPGKQIYEGLVNPKSPKRLDKWKLGSRASNIEMNYLLNKHTRPIPRIKEAQLAAKIGTKAAIDISDGLVSDCSHICKESNLGCTIYTDKIPISSSVIKFCTENKFNPLDFALSGGEDYELAFSVSPKLTDKLTLEFEKHNYKLTKIGIMTKDKSIQVLDNIGEPIDWRKGYEHFI